ncbi:MAG: hypothetical protein KGJ55_00420 [Gammaproteobacteria bacterium]|nr:hypothetical protein [Gammaproteobacteria bacterium]
MPFVTVADLLLDVIGRLRECNCEVALVTDDGKLDSSDQTRGVVALSDLILGAQLPHQLLNGRSGRARSRPAVGDGA